MNYRFTTILLTVVLMLVLIVPGIAAAPGDPAEGGQIDPTDVVAPAGNYDFTNHGTAWLPELPGKFDMNRPVGWGKVLSPTLVGQYWVHIPVPYPSVISSTAMKIKYVEFCAQSTNGAGGTKPVQMDLWEYPGKFQSVAISWPADNNKHCFGYSFATAEWHQDLGISVSLNFTNAADNITLYKAWVRLQP